MGLLASRREVLAGRVDVDGRLCPGFKQSSERRLRLPRCRARRPVDTVGSDDVDQLLRGPTRAAEFEATRGHSPHRVRRIR
jgi:hypothetical protein